MSNLIIDENQRPTISYEVRKDFFGSGSGYTYSGYWVNAIYLIVDNQEILADDSLVVGREDSDEMHQWFYSEEYALPWNEKEVDSFLGTACREKLSDFKLFEEITYLRSVLRRKSKSLNYETGIKEKLVP